MATPVDVMGPTRSFRICEDGRLQPQKAEAALASWRQGDGSFWIDLEGPDIDARRKWLERLEIPADLLDAFLEPEHFSRVLPAGEAVFFEVPTRAADATARTVVVSFVCLDRLVLSMHEESVQTMQQLDASGYSRVRLDQATTSSLVCGLLILESARSRELSINLRHRVAALAERMDTEADGVALDEILELKRNLLDSDSLADEQLAVFQILLASRKPALDLSRMTDLFQVAINHAEAVERSVDRLVRSVQDLQMQYQVHQQEKTNRRLGLLTILSAVFMPLTLMVGIWGMNFEFMPELSLRWGYPAALAAMATLGGGLLWYFRSHGWLD